MRVVVWIVVLLFCVGLVLSSPHSDYPTFAQHEDRATLVDDLFLVHDDLIFYRALYSIDGGNWQPIDLQGSAYRNSDRWLKNSAAVSLPSFGVGEHYVIAFTCSLATLENLSKQWDCHGGQWQLLVVTITESDSVDSCEGISCPPPDECTTGVCVGGECEYASIPGCELVVLCDAPTQSQSCSIEHGLGEQTRSCTDGEYSEWSSCTIISCNDGYKEVNGACIKESAGEETIPTGYLIADHTVVDDFEIIPQCWIERVKQELVIGYGHTSHGSQLSSGLNGLNRLMNDEGANNLYAVQNGHGSLTQLSLHEGDGYGDGWLDHDVGYGGWWEETRGYLEGIDDSGLTADHSDVNTIMWSWCGQVNSVNLQTHLFNHAEAIQSEYPQIDFVFMTGHLESNQAVLEANNEIRDYVKATDGILFDFADIEKWDPGGVEHPTDTDSCGWCTSWCNRQIDECTPIVEAVTSCAHSHDYNCYRKAKAFWWLAARMVGWDGTAGDACP